MQAKCERTAWKSLPVDAFWWKNAVICQATKNLLPLKVIVASALSFLIAWIRIFSLQKKTLQSRHSVFSARGRVNVGVSASKIYVCICCICFFSWFNHSIIVRKPCLQNIYCLYGKQGLCVPYSSIFSSTQTFWVTVISRDAGRSPRRIQDRSWTAWILTVQQATSLFFLLDPIVS